jgi:opacity protein-like surface antigen
MILVMPIFRGFLYLLLAATGLAASGQGALAQAVAGPYAGVGLSFAHGESEAGVGPVGSEGDLTALSFVLGNKWVRDDLSYAIELDADVNVGGDLKQDGPCGVDAIESYMCEQDSTVRLRGLVGTPLGDAELFGAVGVGATFGTFATGETSTGSGSVYGLTLGAGVNYPLRNGMNIRGEVNYDNFNNADQPSDQESDWNSLSVRLMAVFNF